MGNEDVFPDGPAPARRVVRRVRPGQPAGDGRGEGGPGWERARALHAAAVRWLRAEPDPPDLAAPLACPVGGHAHRLALPGAGLPRDGEARSYLGRAWRWDAAANAWRRVG
jgi:hypothetical protein